MTQRVQANKAAISVGWEWAAPVSHMKGSRHLSPVMELGPVLKVHLARLALQLFNQR